MLRPKLFDEEWVKGKLSSSLNARGTFTQKRPDMDYLGYNLFVFVVVKIPLKALSSKRGCHIYFYCNFETPKRERKRKKKGFIN